MAHVDILDYTWRRMPLFPLASQQQHDPSSTPYSTELLKELTDFLTTVMCNHYAQLGPELLQERVHSGS